MCLRIKENVERIWPWAVGVLVGLACLFAIADTVVDPDLWGHLTFGRDILRTGRVVQVDCYSCLSDRPWINHEWLSEVIFASVYDVAGPSGLVAFKMGLGLVMIGLGFRQLHKGRMSLLASMLFLLAVTLALRPGLGTVRPQIFTYVMFLVLMLILKRSTEGQVAPLLLAAPLFAAWINLHGGVLAGIAVLCVWALATTGTMVANQKAGESRRPGELATIGLAVALALSAVVLNPYGTDLIRFLLATTTVPRPEIWEWAPVSLGSLPGLAYLALLAISGWSWIGTRRPRHLGLVLVHLTTAVAPLVAVRHLPLFALATMTLVGEHAADVWNASLDWGTRAEPPRVWLMVPVAGMILIMTLLNVRAFQGIRIVPTQFDFPARAMAILERGGVEGNLLVDFNWGEYVIWHLGPRVRVSIDGRRETVYSPSMLRLNDDLRQGRPGWQEILRRGKLTMALLRRGTVPDQLMRRQASWQVAYEDAVCALHVQGRETVCTPILQAPQPALPCDGAGMWLPPSYPVREKSRGVAGVERNDTPETAPAPWGILPQPPGATCESQLSQTSQRTKDLRRR